MSKAKSSTLTAERACKVLAYDPKSGVIIRKVRQSSNAPAGSIAGNLSRSHSRIPRRVVCIDGTQYLASRIAWLIHYGKWPDYDIDHINGDPLDNTITNLRDATRHDNLKNAARRTDNTSGITGVYWNVDRGKWQAQIGVDGRVLYIGLFSSIDQAIAARKRAEREHGFHDNHGRINLHALRRARSQKP